MKRDCLVSKKKKNESSCEKSKECQVCGTKQMKPVGEKAMYCVVTFIWLHEKTKMEAIEKKKKNSGHQMEGRTRLLECENTPCDSTNVNTCH